MTAKKMYLAKVKGESKYMAHNGKDFYITDKKADASKFTADYIKEITASNWGGKTWEKKDA